MESVESVDVVEDTTGMTEMQKKLFNIRMKINQGRKANKAEVEDEYRRFNDPKYEQKKYVSRKNEQAADQVDGLGDHVEAPPKWNTDKNAFMHQTAESAEQAQEKITRKEKNMATFGWEAFTQEASYKAYKKKLNKLPTAKGIKEQTETELENNPLNYGLVNTTVSKGSLDRLSKDITDREEANRRFVLKEVLSVCVILFAHSFSFISISCSPVLFLVLHHIISFFSLLDSRSAA